MNTLHGSIQGGQVQIDGNPALPEGAQVEVRIVLPDSVAQEAAKKRIGSYQALTDWSEEDDRILAEIDADRRRPSHRFRAEEDSFE